MALEVVVATESGPYRHRCIECARILRTAVPRTRAAVVCEQCVPAAAFDRQRMEHARSLVRSADIGEGQPIYKLLGPLEEEGRFRAYASRWVSCTACGAARGDDCRHGQPCDARVEARADEIADLPTWCVVVKTACCTGEVGLLYRTLERVVEWHSVPCPTCGQTFAYQLDRDLAPPEDDSHLQATRAHPQLAVMHCWAHGAKHDG